MKFNEYVSKEEKRKIDRKNKTEKQENVILKALKAIPNLAIKLIKTTIKIFAKIVKMAFLFIKFLINELLEFLMLLNQVMTGASEFKQKAIIGSILAIILLLTGFGIYTKHQNKVLSDNIASIEESIETGEKKPIEKKETKKDSNKEVNKTLKAASSQEVFGDVYFNSRVEGKSDYYGKGYVRYKENGEVKVIVCKTYGLGEFTDNPKSGYRYVKNVTDYIKKQDPQLYNTYFANVNGPGTTTFTTGWQTAARKEEDKMKKYQFEYLYITYVKDTMSDLKSKYNLDTNNKAIKELVFSTAVQYGYKGTLYIFEQAEITKDMSVEEVVNKIEDEKINSINNYTYTDGYKYDDQDRENIKTQIETEKKEILKLI